MPVRGLTLLATAAVVGAILFPFYWALVTSLQSGYRFIGRGVLFEDSANGVTRGSIKAIFLLGGPPQEAPSRRLVRRLRYFPRLIHLES